MKDTPDIVTLRQKVTEAAQTCNDPDLLDLIYKLLKYDKNEEAE